MFGLAAATSTAVWSICASAQTEAPNRQPATNAQSRNDTIVVQGRRPAATRTIDGTTYDVRDNPQAAAGTAADVLNTIPSVSVSPDGAVAVRGSGNVQVYVNGRPSAMMNGESRASSLQSISGGAIASVEVITNPSARYDANGSTIVNLTLSRAQEEGLRGTATFNAGDHRRANAALDSSFRDGRLSATLSAGIRDEVRFTELSDDRRLLSSDGSQAERFLSTAHYTPTHARSATASASLGYRLTPASDIGADFAISTGSPWNKVYEHHRDYGPDDQLLVEYQRVRGGSYVSTSSDASVYYERRGTPGSASLKVVAQHGTSGLRANRLFATSYGFPDLAPTEERVLNRTVSRTGRVAFDYEKPLGSNLRLSLGSEWKRDLDRYVNGHGIFAASVPDPASAPLGLTLFEAVQRTAAGYVNLQAQSGPWTLQAGARFEHIGIGTTLSADAFRTRRHFSALNRSAAISRSLGHDQLVVRYARTLQRFDPQDLNPSVVYVDAQHRHAGNPDLRPQRVTSLEAEYDFHRGGMEGAATLYYRGTDRTIADYSEFLDDNVLITTKRNGGRSQSFGFEANANLSLTGSLRLGLTVNLFQAELSTLDPGGNQVQSRFSYTLQGSADWTATPRDRLHMDANLQGPSLVPQGVRSGTSALNLVWRHTLGRTLTFTLTARALVNDSRVLTIIRTPNAVSFNDRESGGRAILVGLSYRIR
jgi:hypothetical protein